MDFGNRLKELRKQAGLTQQQLANQVGLSKTVISYYELHTRIPSPEVLIKLASVFHVSADYLLGIEKKNRMRKLKRLNKSLYCCGKRNKNSYQISKHR